MKILFIAGSLEMGKDGVGDYTRRLACELIKRNHQIEILAINDKYVPAEWNGMQNDAGTDVYVKRLPSGNSWQDRLVKAREYVDYFAPEWISLQFVLFTFDKKGLPFRLSVKLKKINDGRAKWHIMFHELWVGMNEYAPFKQKVLGVIQKQILKSFLKQLSPDVIHTHANIYQHQLSRLHYDAKPLPLFTNLPVDETVLEPSAEDKKEEMKTTLIFILFGGIHPQTPVENFADELARYAVARNIRTEVRIVGRTGKEQEVWLAALQANHIVTKVTGELSANNVSKEIVASHYGLSTTPELIADKSSSISTMLGHGLPVICVASPHRIAGKEENDSLQCVFKYKPGNLSGLLDKPYQRPETFPTLSDVSSQFISDLSNANSKNRNE